MVQGCRDALHQYHLTDQYPSQHPSQCPHPTFHPDLHITYIQSVSPSWSYQIHMDNRDKDVKEIQLIIKCREFKLAYGSYRNACTLEHVTPHSEEEYNYNIFMLHEALSAAVMLQAIAKAKESSNN